MNLETMPRPNKRMSLPIQLVAARASARFAPSRLAADPNVRRTKALREKNRGIPRELGLRLPGDPTRRRMEGVQNDAEG